VELRITIDTLRIFYECFVPDITEHFSWNRSSDLYWILFWDRSGRCSPDHRYYYWRMTSKPAKRKMQV